MVNFRETGAETYFILFSFLGTLLVLC